MQPAVMNSQVSYTVPDGMTVTAIPKASLPAIFIGERLIVYAIVHQSSPLPEAQEGSIRLTGDLLGAKVEHNMMFQVPLAVTKENVLQVSTIHHLAAKKLIKEMELDLDGSTEIIKLSCDSNVISSQTAFIAIDEERKEAVKGSLETWDILPDDEEGFLCYSQPVLIKCGRPMALKASKKKKSKGFSMSNNLPSRLKFDNPVFSSPGPGAPGTPFASIYDSDDEGASAVVPVKSSFNAMAPRSEKKSKGIILKGFSMPKMFSRSKRKSPASSTSSSADQEYEYSAESKEEYADRSTTINPLGRIINLQLASGAWKMSTELADVIVKTTAEIKDACPVPCEGDMETTWATIIVLIYLQLRQSNFKDEWELVAAKAETWLTKQNLPEGCSIQVLREKGTAFLS